jgi:type VI secretion system secreted protein Hcp
MLNAFLKLDGIDGEATEENHKNWIALLSFGHTIDQKASPGPDANGRLIAAAATHGVIKVSKAVDQSTPTLLGKCTSGASIPKAQIHFVRAAGDQKVTYLTVELEKVILSQVKMISNGSDATDGASSTAQVGSEPEESVSLSYNRIRWTYKPQDADNNVKGQLTSSWDLTTHAKWG